MEPTVPKNAATRLPAGGENGLIVSHTERRWWPRLKVNWRMRLFRAGDPMPLSATVDNISGGGLFFKSATRISGGERLRSEIVLPIKAPPHGQAVLLKCDLVVVRAESGGFGYGAGCQFSHYSVQLPHHDPGCWQEAVTDVAG